MHLGTGLLQHQWSNRTELIQTVNMWTQTGQVVDFQTHQQDPDNTNPKTLFRPQSPMSVRDYTVYSKLYHTINGKSVIQTQLLRKI